MRSIHPGNFGVVLQGGVDGMETQWNAGACQVDGMHVCLGDKRARDRVWTLGAQDHGIQLKPRGEQADPLLHCECSPWRLKIPSFGSTTRVQARSLVNSMSEVGNQVVSPPPGTVPRAKMGTMQSSQDGAEGVVGGRWNY